MWQLHIFCPGALSINLTYDKFWLPDGAKFFIYSNDKTQTIGAITYDNAKCDKENIRGFATSLLYTNSITLEYYLPKNVKEKGVICIDKVVHGYRGVISMDLSNKLKETLQAASAYCYVDINCPEGDD